MLYIVSMSKIKHIVLLLTLIISPFILGQKGKTYVGFQFKPIIPNTVIGQFEQNYVYDQTPRYEGIIKQKPGLIFGMVIRHGLSKNISLETGINYSRRRYDISYVAADSGFSLSNDLTLINYDIPINGLIYIQLSDTWFMNASAGINLSFYPTSVFTQAPHFDVNNQFYQVGNRVSWIQTGINANYGFEYRMKKNGAFYIGASFSQPFSHIMDFILTWKNHDSHYRVYEEIDGSYLTIDFKYFIPKL